MKLLIVMIGLFIASMFITGCKTDCNSNIDTISIDTIDSISIDTIVASL